MTVITGGAENHVRVALPVTGPTRNATQTAEEPIFALTDWRTEDLLFGHIENGSQSA